MFRKILFIVVVSLFIFGMNKLSFAMMCSGHSQHLQIAQAESGEHKDTEHQATAESTSKEAVDVGNKICPVSGEKINEKVKATYEYQGKIYNFCCQMCIDEFKKNPEKYIKKVEEELKAESKKDAKIEKKTRSESHEGMHMHEGHHH